VSVDNDLLEETDEHDHDHDHESHSDVESHDAEHSHSDINAHYHYHCSKPAALNNLDLAGFFKQFPRTEKIRVQFITADQQQGVELSHEHTQFNW
jgi:hypothetical protein